MKLCTFDLSDGSRHIGAVIDDQHLVDFTSGSPDPMFRDMLALIDAGDAGLAAARQLVQSASVVRKIAEVRYAAALPQPRQMRDFLCFEKHFRQARANRYLFAGANSAAAARSPGTPFSTADTERDPAKVEIPAIWYQEPIYYKCNRFSVVGTDTDVINPRYCKMLDYELEFAAVLGKGGVNIRKEQAAEHIYGYCIFNDFSDRDQQMREMSGSLGPSKGKDFDTGNAIGPWLVTRDEVADPYNLTMVARVNGEEWSRGNSGEMYHKFEDVLAHVSKDETLYPGEFLGSGTVGNGCGLELGRFLKHGDVVELEIQGLGILRNRIVFQS